MQTDEIDGCVHEGDWAVLRTSDGRQALGCVKAIGSARLGRRKHRLAPLLGTRWGNVFRVSTNGLIACDEKLERTKQAANERTIDEERRDNREVVDSEDNQVLGQEEIQRMKISGVDGAEVVERVLKGSKTFLKKTAFAQDKYRKRKEAKHDLKVRVLKPSARLLIETYFLKSPDKVMHMRGDALALMFGYSGVRAGAQVILFEECSGILTASTLERMGEQGRILNIFAGSSPPGNDIIRMLNCDPYSPCIIHVPLELVKNVNISEKDDLGRLRYSRDETRETGGELLGKRIRSSDKEEKTEEENGKENDNNKGIAESREETKYEPSAQRLKTLQQRPLRGQVKTWLKEGADCLMLATRGDVIKVMSVLFPFLGTGGAFAIFNDNLQPLAELQYSLMLSKMAARVELMECGVVNHQVLPGRTHPFMTDSATGGYILSGIRLAPD